jgi:hypothetical protein
MTTSTLRRLVASSSFVVFLASQSAQSAIVYDNSTNDKTNRFVVPSFQEVGDEIILAGTARQITTFTFEYFALNLSGDELAVVKFYANDGAVSSSGFRMPGTVLWNSLDFSIQNTPRATLTFDLTSLNIVVPDSFTWTVEFKLGATSPLEQAGVDIYTPPTVGSNYEDYWERTGPNSWVLKQNGLVSMDFAARIGAIPEPSAFAIFGVAAAGLALAWKRRQR